MTTDTLTVPQTYTVDEYFVRDERSEEKLEYHNGKFMMYRTLPSLREYVLIEQDRPRVTTFYRNEAGLWQDTDVADLTQSVRLQSLGGDISLARLYKGIDFTAQLSSWVLSTAYDSRYPLHSLPT